MRRWPWCLFFFGRRLDDDGAADVSKTPFLMAFFAPFLPHPELETPGTDRREAAASIRMIP